MKKIIEYKKIEYGYQVTYQDGTSANLTELEFQKKRKHIYNVKESTERIQSLKNDIFDYKKRKWDHDAILSLLLRLLVMPIAVILPPLILTGTTDILVFSILLSISMELLYYMVNLGKGENEDLYICTVLDVITFAKDSMNYFNNKRRMKKETIKLSHLQKEAIKKMERESTIPKEPIKSEQKSTYEPQEVAQKLKYNGITRLSVDILKQLNQLSLPEETRKIIKESVFKINQELLEKSNCEKETYMKNYWSEEGTSHILLKTESEMPFEEQAFQQLLKISAQMKLYSQNINRLQANIEQLRILQDMIQKGVVPEEEEIKNKCFRP